MTKRVDRTGDKHGLWTLLSFDRREVRPNGKGINFWWCLCSCGTTRSVNYSHLRKGNSKSCGCANPGNVTHGLSDTPAHRSWSAMISRCKNHPHYIARGIKVSKDWKKFEHFYRDMGDRPSGLTLDRIDGRKGYSKSNCRWATQAEQNRNQTRYYKKRKEA